MLSLDTHRNLNMINITFYYQTPSKFTNELSFNFMPIHSNPKEDDKQQFLEKLHSVYFSQNVNVWICFLLAQTTEINIQQCKNMKAPQRDSPTNQKTAPLEESLLLASGDSGGQKSLKIRFCLFRNGQYCQQKFFLQVFSKFRYIVI